MVSGSRVREWWSRLSSFLTQTRRVLTVTRKPTSTEYRMIVKITALGIAILGLIGFLIQIGKQVLFQ